MDTQWRTIATQGGVRFLGLDYAAAAAGLQLAGIAPEPADWERLRVIEAAANAALNGD